MTKKTILTLAVSVTLAASNALDVQAGGARPVPRPQPLRLWYDRPADDSVKGGERQSLPIGCGHFGVSVFGNVTNERLQVTHNAVLTAREHFAGSPVAFELKP